MPDAKLVATKREIREGLRRLSIGTRSLAGENFGTKFADSVSQAAAQIQDLGRSKLDTPFQQDARNARRMLRRIVAEHKRLAQQTTDFRIRAMGLGDEIDKAIEALQAIKEAVARQEAINKEATDKIGNSGGDPGEVWDAVKDWAKDTWDNIKECWGDIKEALGIGD